MSSDVWLFLEAGEEPPLADVGDAANPWLEEDSTTDRRLIASEAAADAPLPQRVELPVDGQPSEEEVKEEEEDLSALRWGAATLAKKYGAKVGRVGESLDGLHRSSVLQRIRAAAEAACKAQESFLQRLLAIVGRLCHMGHFRPVTFIEHVAHDETKLEVKVRFPADSHSEKQQARCFVVEQSFSMLLEFIGAPGDDNSAPQQFLTLEGSFSPSIRAGDTATGETIAAVLNNVNPTPLPLLQAAFPDVVRVIETDECGANPRAESLVMKERQEKFPEMEIGHLTSFCLCHKVHSAAAKSWTLQPDVVSGLINVAKFLQGPGTMKKLRDSVFHLLSTHLQKKSQRDYIEPRDSQEYRQWLLCLFLPEHGKSRRRANVLAAFHFFNADMRERPIKHICAGPMCCHSFQHCLAQARHHMRNVLSAVRPLIFNKSNWLQWSSATHFFGLASGMHNLIVDAFVHAFCTAPAAAREHNSEDVGATFLEGEQH
eukprot:6470178-Amphidinium_carterae.1